MLTILGPLRSGTSRVARIAHQMGVDLGATMRFPPPGRGLDPEYEDRDLADKLTRWALLDQPIRGSMRPDIADFLERYVECRKFLASGRPWGIKTPLLSLCWREWKKALVEADEHNQVVLCSRSRVLCQRSVARCARSETELQALRDVAHRVDEALATISLPDRLVIPFEMPGKKVRDALAALLDLPGPHPDALTGIRH